MAHADVPEVIDELTEVLRELVGDAVDLDDPVAVIQGIEAAASGASGRPAAEIARLLVRLDLAIARGRETAESLGLEVSRGE